MSSTSAIPNLNSIPPCIGVDDWNHRPFITTNEEGAEQMLDILSGLPLNGNAMLGVSGFFLLNAAGERASFCDEETGKIDTLILIDNSIRVEDFWQRVQPIIIQAENRGEVTQKIINLLIERKDQYYSGHPNPKETSTKSAQYQITKLNKEIESRNSWLSTDETFKRIQDIFRANRFVFKRIDLYDTQSITQLTDLLAQQGIRLDSVYVSNIAEYVTSDAQRESYRHSVKKLVEDKPLLIFTLPRKCVDREPLQQIVVNNIQHIDDLTPFLLCQSLMMP